MIIGMASFNYVVKEISPRVMEISVMQVEGDCAFHRYRQDQITNAIVNPDALVFFIGLAQ